MEKRKAPELATFTFLNPDFNVLEEQKQRKMPNEKGEKRHNIIENEK